MKQGTAPTTPHTVGLKIQNQYKIIYIKYIEKAVGATWLSLLLSFYSMCVQ